VIASCKAGRSSPKHDNPDPPYISTLSILRQVLWSISTAQDLPVAAVCVHVAGSHIDSISHREWVKNRLRWCERDSMSLENFATFQFVQHKW